MLRTQLKWILTVALTCLCGVVHAESVTILPFQGDSVHPQIRSAARDALSIFLTDNKVDVKGNQLKEPVADRAAADAAAKKVGASSYVQGRITRLGSRAIVQVQKYAVGNDTASYSDRMTAATPTDLETVMQRLARSLATGKKSVKNENIHTVTQREQNALRRRVANQYFGLTLGGQISAGHGTGFMPGFGFSWLWDNRNVLLGADLRFAGVGTDSTAFDLSISGYYPFTESDTTPYLGGGLALSGLSTKKELSDDDISTRNHYYEDEITEDKSGMSFFVAGGLLIGRTSTVSIRPEMAYSVGTYTLDGKLVHGLRFGLTLGF